MSKQTWVEQLVAAQVDGPSLSLSAAQTSILPAHAKIVLPANYFEIGKTLRIEGMARLSNIVTTPGTLKLEIKLGSTVVFDGGAMQLSTTAHTTLPLFFDILLQCRAVGSAANLMGRGRATSQCLSLTAVADSATTPATLLLPNVTLVVGANFDSSIAHILDLFATFSIADAGNLLQLHQYSVEALN